MSDELDLARYRQRGCFHFLPPGRNFSIYIKSLGGRLRRRTSEVDGTPRGRVQKLVCPALAGQAQLRNASGRVRTELATDSKPLPKKNRARTLRARSVLSLLAPPVAQSERAEHEEDAAQDAARDGHSRCGEDFAAGRRRRAGHACGLPSSATRAGLGGRVGRTLAGRACAVADLGGGVGRAAAVGAGAVADLGGGVGRAAAVGAGAVADLGGGVGRAATVGAGAVADLGGGVGRAAAVGAGAVADLGGGVGRAAAVGAGAVADLGGGVGRAAAVGAGAVADLGGGVG